MKNNIYYTHKLPKSMDIAAKIATCDNMVLLLAICDDIDNYLDAIDGLAHAGKITRHTAETISKNIDRQYKLKAKSFRNYN